MQQLELTIDVTAAAGLEEPAHVAVTVCLPATEVLSSPAIVCFAKPGAGFSRRYFTLDLPGPARGSQAEWHTGKGWIFVAVDHLGVGDSSKHDPSRLDFSRLAAANNAAEGEVMQRLASGELAEGFPPVRETVVIGIGQSMGGCLTVVQQGRHHCYDGIAILGFSAVRILPPSPPGHPGIVAAIRVPVGQDSGSTLLLNERQFTSTFRAFHGRDPSPTDVLANSTPEASAWHYYYDDVVEYLPQEESTAPCPWLSTTVPGVIQRILTPGIIAAEAASVDTPVLVAMGERDVVVDPQNEGRAYYSAPSVEIFVCPHMGHMHNFAGTRELFWKRVHCWAAWVVNFKLAGLRPADACYAGDQL